MRWLLVLMLQGCLLPDPGGGGTGGGGGAGGGAQSNTFTKGFVFVRRDDREVYATDQSDLSTVYRLTLGANARTPSLSHDGKTVVFVHVSDSDTELDVVPVRGGTPTQVLLASATPTVSNLRTPVFTPDGAHVVFSYDDSGSSSVGIVDLAGTGFRKVSPLSGFAYSGASVFPDGSAVLVAAGATVDQLSQLNRIELTTGAETVIAQTLGTNAVNLVSRVVVSPDGTLAAFDARVASSSVRIFAMDLTTLLVGQLTDYPGEPGANDSAPCWEGANVCFSSDVGGDDAAYALPAGALLTSGGLQLPAAIDPWFGPN